MAKLDVVVIGELSVESIFDNISHGLPQAGKERIAEDFSLVLGSSSAILAMNLARLGVAVGFVGKVGNDQFGRFILDALHDSGVDTSQVKLSKELKTGFSAILNHAGNRAAVTYPGAMKELRIGDIDFDNLKGAQHLHLSSYYLQSGIRPDCREVFRRARNVGMKTSLDTNWDPEEQWGNDVLDVLAEVDTFLPNEEEAKAIGKSNDVAMVLERLSTYAETVVIKRGANGAIARSHDIQINVEGLPVVPVDVVGAGESFNAGYIAKRITGGDLRSAVQFGNLCGAYSTQKAGGTAAFAEQDKFKLFIEEYALSLEESGIS